MAGEEQQVRQPGTPPLTEREGGVDSAARTSQLLSDAGAWLERSEELAQETHSLPLTSSALASVAAIKREQVRRRSPTVRVSKPARAKQDFVAIHDDDLGFKKGEPLIVTKANPARHWWSGYVDGDTSRSGSFPKEAVELLEEQRPTAQTDEDVSPLVSPGSAPTSQPQQTQPQQSPKLRPIASGVELSELLEPEPQPELDPKLEPEGEPQLDPKPEAEPEPEYQGEKKGTRAGEYDNAEAPPVTPLRDVAKQAGRKLVTRVSDSIISDDGSADSLSSQLSGLLKTLPSEDVTEHATRLAQKSSMKVRELDEEYQLQAKARELQKQQLSKLKELDDEFQLAGRVKEISQQGKKTVKQTIASATAAKDEVLRSLADKTLDDIADAVEAHSSMLSPALQTKLGIPEEAINDPDNPINKSVDRAVQMLRQKSGDTPRVPIRRQRHFDDAPAECQEAVLAALRSVYSAMDTNNDGQLSVAQLRQGLIKQTGGASAMEADPLSAEQTYILVGRMDTDMLGYVSLDGFTQYAVNQCGGRLADLAETHMKSEIDLCATLMVEAALLIIDSARKALAGAKKIEKVKSVAMTAVEKSKSRLSVAAKLFDSDEEEGVMDADDQPVSLRESLEPAAKLAKSYQSMKGHLAKLERTQAILDERINSMKGKAKDLVVDEVEQAMIDIKQTLEQQHLAEGADGKQPFWKGNDMAKYGSLLNLLTSGKMAKVDRQLAIHAFFATVELFVTEVLSFLVLFRMPVVALCFIALATSWSALSDCGGDFGWVRYFLLMACLLELMMITGRFMFWLKIFRYNKMEKALEKELRLQEKAVREKVALQREQEQQHLVDEAGRHNYDVEDEQAAMQRGHRRTRSDRSDDSTTAMQRGHRRTRSDRSDDRTIGELHWSDRVYSPDPGYTDPDAQPEPVRPDDGVRRQHRRSASDESTHGGSNAMSERGSLIGSRSPARSQQSLSFGGAVMTGKAQAKFKRPLKRKVATAIKTNVMVAEQVLLSNAKARLQLGREAVLIQHYLTHSKLTIFLRVVSWLSFGWGAYGVWVILRTGSPLFDDDVCDRIGFFTVSIKFWVTQYFTYLMLSVLQLVCNTMYITVRQCKLGENVARRYAKFKDNEHGLPVPLYELVLDHWVLHEQADDQTLARMAEKNAKDETDFLAAKQKRLEQELQEVGTQLQRCSSALASEGISSPTVNIIERRRARAPESEGAEASGRAEGMQQRMHANASNDTENIPAPAPGPGPEPEPEPEEQGQEEAEPPWEAGCSPKTSDAVQRTGAYSKN